MTAFETFWRIHFPTTPPISSKVREAHKDRWVRFHALPQSKRYAENNEERAVILRRANAIGDAMFGASRRCWLVKATYPSHEMFAEPALPDLALEPAFSIVDEDQSVAISARQIDWTSSAFDRAFQLIADDKIYSLFFAHVATGSVLAPYDGGFDTILPGAEEVARVRKFHPDWLSSLESGY